DERRLRDLGGEDDLDRRALDGERIGAGGGGGEADVDRMGDERLGRAVDVGEADPFRRQALLLDEFAEFEHGAEADAETAGPIADADLVLVRVLRVSRDRGYGHGNRGNGGGRDGGQPETADRHRAFSCWLVASSEARSSAVSATVSGVPVRGW